MMHLDRSLHAGLLLLVVSSSLHAVTYQVAQLDPKASDDGPGTSQQPWKTVTKAAQTAGPGDIVVIRDGIYRERIIAKINGTPQKPIRFDAAPGSHVVLTGADRLTGWQKANDNRPSYSITWPYRFITWSKRMAHPDDDYHLLIGRCEQVAIDNYLLHQVLEGNQLAPGTFFADTSNQVLQVWDRSNRDLNKVLAEASVRQEILRVEADYVEVRGLHFRFAANMAQHGAVFLGGLHDVLEDCVIENMNASGATFTGQQQIIRRCIFRDNGQLGFGASRAHQLLFTECRVENNNTKGFDRGWEAGGDKLALCRDVILDRSQFVRNRGNGIWFDIGNEHCTVRQCLIADNEDSGIFYEISFGLQAHDNVIVGNGFAATAGAWGAQAGIAISSSPGCVTERNLIVGNKEGFNFREQTRNTPTIDNKQDVPVWNHDELVRHNIIAFNRDAQVWGWFDLKDNRHWPVAGQTKNRVASTGEASKPRERDARSQELTLEELRLRFEENVYFAETGQGWFEWGVTWGRHKSYRNLTDFRTDLGIDVGSIVLDPHFGDMMLRDYRLRPQTMSKLTQNYPRGPVPGVILGEQP
jgi:hypothetical protein